MSIVEFLGAWFFGSLAIVFGSLIYEKLRDHYKLRRDEPLNVWCECGAEFKFINLGVFKNKAPIRINGFCPECGRGYLIRLDRDRDADNLEIVAKRLVRDAFGGKEEKEELEKEIREALDNL